MPGSIKFALLVSENEMYVGLNIFSERHTCRQGNSQTNIKCTFLLERSHIKTAVVKYNECCV